MNLDKELKDLFFCLLSDNDWVTGEELVGKLGWNRKKVQQNMRWLMDELKGQCSIESQKNRGYLLLDLSNELKAAALQEVFYNDSYFHLDERRTVLLMALMFQKDYISMDKLAEDYYLSKTAVFEEIRQMKRWFQRIEYLELEVSTKKGIRIHGTERTKRYGCAAFAQLNILKLMNIDQMAVLRYQGILKSSARILRKRVIKDNIMISGEDFFFILRYIGITCMRSSMGYLLEDAQNTEVPVMLDELFDELSQVTGYIFSVQEQEDIMEIIRFSNVVSSERVMETDFSHVLQLEQWIIDKLKLNQKQLFENRELFEQNMRAVFHRSTHNWHGVNYYDRDIMCKYPLCLHISYQGILNIYGCRLSRSDTLDMAVYLGGFLENLEYPSKLRVLLAGNQNFQLLEPIRKYVMSVLPGRPARFDLLPCYVLEDVGDRLKEEYDLLLTTETEMLIKYEDFIQVPVIMTTEHIRLLKMKIEKWLKEYQKKELDNMEQCMEIQMLDKLENFGELLSEDELKHTTIYALSKSVLCMIHTAPFVKTGIRKILLQKSFLYDFKMISQILLIQFDENDPGLIDFFIIVSHLLQKQK